MARHPPRSSHLAGAGLFQPVCEMARSLPGDRPRSPLIDEVQQKALLPIC
jgi:hypothetical protein